MNDLDLMLAVALTDEIDPCPAWMETAERRCGKARAIGFLCQRHHAVAVRRLQARQAADAAQAEEAAERRARKLPAWRAELDRVEARMRVLDPPADVTDRAAYTGAVHPSLRRRQARLLSDSRVEEMARLVVRAEQLRRLIGPAALVEGGAA